MPYILRLRKPGKVLNRISTAATPELGADPSIKNEEGLSPQELAEKLVEEATIEDERR